MSDYYPPLSCLSDSHKCVFETLTGYMHVLERRMWDTTVLGVSVRVLFPNGQRTAANAHEHTHTHTPTHMHTLCLELRALLFTKEWGCFMCVWLSLFQPAWNSQPHSESLHCAWRGGLNLVWTRHSSSVGALDSDPVCSLDDAALLTCCILSGHNKGVWSARVPVDSCLWGFVALVKAFGIQPGFLQMEMPLINPYTSFLYVILLKLYLNKHRGYSGI